MAALLVQVLDRGAESHRVKDDTWVGRAMRGCRSCQLLRNRSGKGVNGESSVNEVSIGNDFRPSSSHHNS
jgi:hypothetical protein